MKKRILLVEDHDDFRGMLKSYLQLHALDLEVFEATTAQDALDKAASVKPDIVVMDINLRGTNGLEIGRQIRKEFPDSHIIFLTIFDVAVFKEAAAKINAAAFIAKTHVYDQLLPAIKNCLTGKK